MHSLDSLNNFYQKRFLQTPLSSFNTIRKVALSAPEIENNAVILYELERQLEVVYHNNQALKIAPLAHAIIDINISNLSAHVALAHFYQHIGYEKEALHYQKNAKKIQRTIQKSGDGTIQKPYQVFSPTEARFFNLSTQNPSIGGLFIKKSNDTDDHLLLFTHQNTDKRSAFSITILQKKLRESFNITTIEQFPHPKILTKFIQDYKEPTAKNTLGFLLIKQMKTLPQGVSILANATKNHATPNALASILLANTLLQSTLQDQNFDPNFLLSIDELFTKASDQHSTLAQRQQATLRFLYPNHFSKSKLTESLESIKKQQSEGNIEGTLLLGKLYLTSSPIHEINYKKAAELFQNLFSIHKNTEALIHLGNIAVFSANEYHSPQIMQSLKKVAKESLNDSAMRLLAYSYMKGLSTEQSMKDAALWFKETLSYTDSPKLINEIAWIFATTPNTLLYDPETALSEMTKLINTKPEASKNPIFLDTFAATIAASGDFEKAKKVQKNAIKYAEQKEEKEILPLLNKHLKLFENQQTIHNSVNQILPTSKNQ